MMDERYDSKKIYDYNLVLHCTNGQLYDRLRSLFQPDMQWCNYGTKLHEWTLEYMIPLEYVYNNILPLNIYTYNGLHKLTIEDMCIYLNVRPVWNNKSNPVLTDTQIMEKCVEIANFIEYESHSNVINKSVSLPVINEKGNL
tara:strand:+ start:6990 stop:7415 length:426 start_codon:yes stop_codon:yes gene_type:complete